MGAVVPARTPDSLPRAGIEEAGAFRRPAPVISRKPYLRVKLKVIVDPSLRVIMYW